MQSVLFSFVFRPRVRLRRARRFSLRDFASKSTPSPSEPKLPVQLAARERGPLSWRALAVFLGIGTGGLAYYTIEKQRRVQEITSVKTVGRAAIGGPFTLTDAKGNDFTEKDLQGRWTLIYFGFTKCPDICPDELEKISESLDKLHLHGKSIGKSMESDLTPILISVDPERDSPSRTQEYATGFHKAFIGLSGTADQIRTIAKAYRVYYSKDETPGDEYLVDHSIITYLMDPNGDFADFFTKNASATEITARVEAKMLSWST